MYIPKEKKCIFGYLCVQFNEINLSKQLQIKLFKSRKINNLNTDKKHNFTFSGAEGVKKYNSVSELSSRIVIGKVYLHNPLT